MFSGLSWPTLDKPFWLDVGNISLSQLAPECQAHSEDQICMCCRCFYCTEVDGHYVDLMRVCGIPGVDMLSPRGTVCIVCAAWDGGEKHLVLECSALNGIRLMFPRLFTDLHTMFHFVNQAAQRDVMHFFTDCLRIHRQL